MSESGWLLVRPWVCLMMTCDQRETEGEGRGEGGGHVQLQAHGNPFLVQSKKLL